MTSPQIDRVLKPLGRKVMPHVPIPIKRQVLYFRQFNRLIPRKPVTFLDKIQWRILHDRRELIAIGGDKIAMKEYAARKSSVRIPRRCGPART